MEISHTDLVQITLTSDDLLKAIEEFIVKRMPDNLKDKTITWQLGESFTIEGDYLRKIV